MDLSIIMINHNTKALTIQAIESILTSATVYSYEIIVVDNSDKTEEKVVYDDPHVVVLPDVENKGFAHGCNAGVAVARGEYYLFLNSDTIMQPDTLDMSLLYMKTHKQVGGFGVKLVLADGTLDHACRRGFPTPWNALCYFSKIDRLFPKVRAFNGYCLRYLSDDTMHEIDAVNGAYLLMPKGVYEKTGGFDEVFFMYGEDLDLCYKIHLAGYKVVYDPLLTCIHLKGKSGRASKNPFVQYHFYNAMLIFYERYYSGKYSGLISRLVKMVLKRKVKQYQQ